MYGPIHVSVPLSTKNSHINCKLIDSLKYIRTNKLQLSLAKVELFEKNA